MTREEAVQKLVTAGRLSVAHAEDLYDSIINKPVVPQYVADWVEKYDYDFDEWFDCYIQPDEIYKWLNCENKRQAGLNALALVTLIVNGRDAVIVEEEPRYTVRIRNLNVENRFLSYNNFNDKWVFSERYISNDSFRITHTRKELLDADFGWVFDCEGIEVTEVE
ncbi:DUF1642 domain-containing protein [Streptococcus thermophilus]|uniref:DUF1642 domain-containing protein n=1 Tax=Streptococcus thermophilus TaxID=1308 RepID=UPI0022EAE54E|nr:DUF1642 domain-containing protein [Streptococcus thermophilus]MDA3774868.1 DUF1642 domain-containing protein [Streptococcus thermophilus]